MKSFEWSNPTTVDEAVKLLGTPALGRADALDPDETPRPLAGGQDLITTMKEYITRPSRVVNLKTIPGLAGIAPVRLGGFSIGALTTLSELEENHEIQKQYPGLAEAAHSVASPQIRNLGTVGGNLCQRPRCWYYRLESVICIKKGGAECYAATGENKYNAILGAGPSFIVHPSDLAPMLIALDATVTIQGPDGVHEIPLDQFFTLPREGNVRRENVLKDGQIITKILLPASVPATRSTYLKFKERASLDFALSSVAAAVDLDQNKNVTRARIVLGGVAPIPWRVQKAEAAIVGKPLTEATVTEAAKLALAGAQPLAHNAYKVPLTQTLVRRALLKLAN